MGRKSVALLVLLVVAVAVVTQMVAAAGGDASSSSTDPVTNESKVTTADYTIDQLRPGGERPANAPPSVRASGTYAQYAVKTLPTHLMVIEGDDSPMWSMMQPGETVRRNYVQLHSRRGFGLENKNVTVRIAYWQTKQVTVEDGNATREETIATNVSTHTVRASIPGGYAPPVRINLNPHYDEKYRVTMCVEAGGEPNCLASPGAKRWTFHHHSAKVAAPIETHSQGSRLAWAFGIIVVPFAGFTAVSLFVGRKFIKSAKGGPSISILAWVLMLIAAIIGILMFWRTVSRMLIRAPWSFAIVGGILLGILATEWFGDNTYIALFLRLRPKDGTDPSVLGSAVEQDPTVDVGGAGEQPPKEVTTTPATDGGSLPMHRRIESTIKAVEQGAAAATSATTAAATGTASTSVLDRDRVPGRLVADVLPQRMARGEGVRTAIKRGWWRFVARARGARADMQVDGNPQTVIDIDGGPYQELYFLNPESTDPIDYKAESHRIEFPELVWRDEETGNLKANWKALIGGPAALGASALLGQVFLASSAIGLLVGGFAVFVSQVYQPSDGRFHVDLAPMHYGNALAGLLKHAGDLGDLKSWETVFSEWHREKAENKAENKALADKASASQMDTLAEKYVGGDSGGDDE